MAPTGATSFATAVFAAASSPSASAKARSVRARRSGRVSLTASAPQSPSPLVGEGRGEGTLRRPAAQRRHTPHLPIALRWAPSSPARGEELWGRFYTTTTSRVARLIEGAHAR